MFGSAWAKLAEVVLKLLAAVWAVFKIRKAERDAAENRDYEHADEIRNRTESARRSDSLFRKYDDAGWRDE